MCGFLDNSCFGLTVALGAIIAFGLIVLQVSRHGPLTLLDLRLAQQLHAGASEPLIGVMRLVSLLHSPGATAVLALPLAAWCWYRRDYFWLLSAGLCLPGGMLLNELIKLAFQRPRPAFVQPLVTLSSYSFPSGHAAATTVLYGWAACYALAAVRRNGTGTGTGTAATTATGTGARWTTVATTTLVKSAALAMIVLVGFSRMYLGAHYLSDVLAGVAESCAWLALCFTLIGALARRRNRGAVIGGT